MEATMEAFKIRVKVGDHEFEAEGPQEAVERQFETFKELVSGVPRTPAKSKDTQTLPADPVREPVNSGNGTGDNEGTVQVYEKLFSQDNGRFSLHYLPNGDDRE